MKFVDPFLEFLIWHPRVSRGQGLIDLLMMRVLQYDLRLMMVSYQACHLPSHQFLTLPSFLPRELFSFDVVHRSMGSQILFWVDDDLPCTF